MNYEAFIFWTAYAVFLAASIIGLTAAFVGLIRYINKD